MAQRTAKGETGGAATLQSTLEHVLEPTGGVNVDIRACILVAVEIELLLIDMDPRSGPG